MHTARQTALTRPGERSADPAIPVRREDHFDAVLSNAPRGVVEFFQISFTHRPDGQIPAALEPERVVDEAAAQEKPPHT